MVGEQVVRMQFVLGNPSLERLVRGPDRLAALHVSRQLRPHLGIDPHPVLRQDVDVLAEPVGLNGDVPLQRLGDFGQYRAHVQVQGRAFIVSQQLAGEGEAERFLAADPHRRQGIEVSSVSLNPCWASS